jgi:transcriptional regulator with XRE-family HTH domain
LSALENNKKKNPSQDIILKIATALEVPVNLLYSNENTINSIVDKLYDISSFSGIGLEELSADEKRQTIKDIVKDEPSLFYELDTETQNEFLVKESSSGYDLLYRKLPSEAKKEISIFMDYIKHKYNCKGE